MPERDCRWASRCHLLKQRPRQDRCPFRNCNINWIMCAVQRASLLKQVQNHLAAGSQYDARTGGLLDRGRHTGRGGSTPGSTRWPLVQNSPLHAVPESAAAHPHNVLARIVTISIVTTAMAKANKSEVGYSRGHAGAHCGKMLDDAKAYCRYFISPLSPVSNLGQREKVAGPINKVYWCRLFARAQSKWTRDPNGQSDFLIHEIRTESNRSLGSVSPGRISRISFA